MRVLNIHSRVVNQPKSEISKLFETLASDDDKMLATDKWPRMKLDKGLKVGSKGGHGSIGYYVTKYKEGEFIQFQFTKPKGFIGVHEFKIRKVTEETTELKHSIKMKIVGQVMLTWPLVIRWLHDAYIEDAFDTVENHFLTNKKRSEWSLWIRFLRKVLRPKKNKKSTLNFRVLFLFCMF